MQVANCYDFFEDVMDLLQENIPKNIFLYWQYFSLLAIGKSALQQALLHAACTAINTKFA